MMIEIIFNLILSSSVSSISLTALLMLNTELFKTKLFSAFVMIVKSSMSWMKKSMNFDADVTFLALLEIYFYNDFIHYFKLKSLTAGVSFFKSAKNSIIKPTWHIKEFKGFLSSWDTVALTIFKNFWSFFA